MDVSLLKHAAREDQTMSRPSSKSSMAKRVTKLNHCLTWLAILAEEAKNKKDLRHPPMSITASSDHYFDEYGNPMPPPSPRENISSMWREIHGLSDWKDLLDPESHPNWLRREIIKYGEFAQATYDAFDFDQASEYRGSCRYNKDKLFKELGLDQHGYDVTKYIYAMSPVDIPDWLEKSDNATWSDDYNWMGYVAVSNDKESKRIGRRDIVVAWRGTRTPSEWIMNIQVKLKEIDTIKHVKVEKGFHTIYKFSDTSSTERNKLSASQQVMQEVERLVNSYGRSEDVSLTVTGHSLGGALALLNAYEAAKSMPRLFVSVISFGAPRVGNLAFKEELNKLGVKTLRIVIEQDMVPKVPGFLFNKIVRKLGPITKIWDGFYRHVGVELKLNVFMSPHLKHKWDLIGFHNLEVYLHLVDGYLRKGSNVQWSGKRDLALVNKGSDMLIEKLRIPESWYHVPYKGLVLNEYGRWVKRLREPEDIPSPPTTESSELDPAFQSES